MRKQTKLVAVLSAAVLLAIGASMTSFAAQGWQEENGTWVYYDKDGYQVTDTWEKSGNNWFYLNGDGEMATEEIIDDGNNYYYVDANGAMVTNQWVAVENESAGEENEPDSYWYYFQANGKAYKSGDSISWKTINEKKYAFDNEGKMLYGWVDKETGDRLPGNGYEAWSEAEYFCGDENDGARASGWAKIDVVDDKDEDQSYWFYFNTANGTKTVDATAKTINGKKYAFNEDGVMQSKWYVVNATKAEASKSNVAGYSYYNQPDEGWRQKGWVKAIPGADIDKDGNWNEDTNWYYVQNNGDVCQSELKTIDSKKYAFNEKGEMMSGLWAIKLDGTKILSSSYKLDNSDKIDAVKGTDFKIYYFGSGDDGAAKVGNQNVEVDGETYSYTFVKTGMDKYTGEETVSSDMTNSKTKAIYVKGQKIKADKDLRYEATDLKGNKSSRGDAYDKYLVNTSGSLMKNKASGVKDSDDFVYKTDKYGMVIEVLDSNGDVVSKPSK